MGSIAIAINITLFAFGGKSTTGMVEDLLLDEGVLGKAPHS
jgi:hypothetical protein